MAAEAGAIPARPGLGARLGRINVRVALPALALAVMLGILLVLQPIVMSYFGLTILPQLRDAARPRRDGADVHHRRQRHRSRHRHVHRARQLHCRHLPPRHARSGLRGAPPLHPRLHGDGGPDPSPAAALDRRDAGRLLRVAGLRAPHPAGPRRQHPRLARHGHELAAALRAAARAGGGGGGPGRPGAADAQRLRRGAARLRRQPGSAAPRRLVAAAAAGSFSTASPASSGSRRA